MTSFRIALTPSRRVATRFINDVRRALQKALAEERRNRGLTQSDIARDIGVHRSVISRELRGHKDITLGRIGELAFALGRDPVIELRLIDHRKASNIPVTINSESSTNHVDILQQDDTRRDNIRAVA